MLDQNFIEHVDTSPQGSPGLYGDLLEWLLVKCENAIRCRKTELFDKKPGALIPRTLEFIWIKMLKRPEKSGSNVFDKCFHMMSNFNTALESLLFKKKSYITQYILSIEVDQEEFLYGGYLTNTGKRRLWHEIDSCIKKFERREINLKPKNVKKKKDSKKLPKLPPHQTSSKIFFDKDKSFGRKHQDYV